MDIDRIILPDDNIRIEQQQLKKIEYHLVKKERKIPGHIMFSYNLVTHEVKQAEVIRCKDIDFLTLQPVHAPKLSMEPNCVYRQALNKKNFIKHLKREGIWHEKEV